MVGLRLRLMLRVRLRVKTRVRVRVRVPLDQHHQTVGSDGHPRLRARVGSP